MATDYRNFKTPFYELTITDPDGKRSVKLPHDILRLIEKIEIFESMMAADQGMLTLTFIEGSREPASPDPSLGTKGLYLINQDIAGSLTNRTGILTDLRFSGSNGITFLSQEEQQTGKLQTQVTNIKGKIVDRKFLSEPNNPKFLFEVNNRVILKFGYLEDPKSVRTIQRTMKIFKVDFPDNAQVVTTITCLDAKSDYDRFVPKQGVKFATFKTTGTGNKLITFEDLSTENTVRNICDTLGIACIVSKNFPASNLDKDHVKSIMGGESLHQFFTRLADLNHAVYSIIPDPKTGIDTVVFLSKTDFEKTPIFKDPNLLTYKAPGSIIKSVNILADLSQITGDSQSSINSEGELVSANNDHGHEIIPMFEGEKLAGIPSSKSIDKLGNLYGQDNIAGRSEINPMQDQPSLLDDKSKINAEKTSRIIQLEMITLGYPKLIPGVIEIQGLGLRYSGKYRIQTARHVIDASGGFTSTITANTMSIATGGVQPQDQTIGTDAKEQETIQLFQPAESNNNSGFSTTVQKNNAVDFFDSYKKLQGFQR